MSLAFAAASAAAADDYSLGDSTYELINTDGETESQDGLATESVASSLDLLAGPDDVDSLAGTDNIHGDKEEDCQEDDTDESGDHGGPWPFPMAHPDETLWHPLAGNPISDNDGRGIAIPARHVGWFLSDDALVEDQKDPGKLIMLKQPTKDVAAEPFATTRPLSNFLNRRDIEPCMRGALLSVVIIIFGALVHFLLPPAREDAVARSPMPTFISSTPSTSLPVATTTAGTAVSVTFTATSTAPPIDIHDFFARMASSADAAVKMVEEVYMPHILSVVNMAWDNATASMKGAGDATIRDASRQNIHRLVSSVEETVARVQREATWVMSHHQEAVEDFRDDLDFHFLKARIQSRLIWLQFRGNQTEYRRYYALAIEFLRDKRRHITDKRARRGQEVRPFWWGLGMDRSTGA